MVIAEMSGTKKMIIIGLSVPKILATGKSAPNTRMRGWEHQVENVEGQTNENQDTNIPMYTQNGRSWKFFRLANGFFCGIAHRFHHDVKTGIHGTQDRQSSIQNTCHGKENDGGHEGPQVLPDWNDIHCKLMHIRSYHQIRHNTRYGSCNQRFHQLCCMTEDAPTSAASLAQARIFFFFWNDQTILRHFSTTRMIRIAIKSEH